MYQKKAPEYIKITKSARLTPQLAEDIEESCIKMNKPFANWMAQAAYFYLRFLEKNYHNGNVGIWNKREDTPLEYAPNNGEIQHRHRSGDFAEW